jgi:ABC-type lipoprotein release transport system permease subunit
MAARSRAVAGNGMIWAKLIFGGIGRRGLEGVVALAVLAVAAAIVAGALMVVEGAKDALRRAEGEDRPDLLHVKSRFNRAVFETPRSGYLPPLTIPVYEPLIDPVKLGAAGGSVLARQVLLRNVVSGDSFLNVYIFGIEPEKEARVSSFSIARGRFLHRGDGAVAVIDKASARTLGVDVGGSFPVRKADGHDLALTVVGILDHLQLRYPPPRTVEAPALLPDSREVSSGVFVTLRTSEEIFSRNTLTDAIVVASRLEDVPSVVDRLREAFRLEPGVFISERYGEFSRKVRDFALTLGLFTIVGIATAVVAGCFAANLLHDVYSDRRRQDATLLALGFSPVRSTLPDIALGIATAGAATLAGSLIAIIFIPRNFAMPSLMADLGSIEPRFDLVVAAAVVVIGIAAIVLGLMPTIWNLHRSSVAAALVEET